MTSNHLVMNWKKIVFVAGSVLILLGAAFIVPPSAESKEGYVEIAQAFESFEMTKEMRFQMEQVQEFRQGIIDSLEVDLQNRVKAFEGQEVSQKDAEAFEALRQQYLVKKEQFSRDNLVMEEDFQNKVLSRMNEYIRDFGKEKGYRFLHGANGQGALLYAGEELDVTEEVIEFINKKYHGEVN